MTILVTDQLNAQILAL